MISTTILQQIVTTNLVTVTLAETQLDINFQIILKALKAHNSALSNWENRISNIEKSLGQIVQKQKQIQQFSTNNIEKLSTSVAGVQKDIAAIHVKLGQMMSPNPQSNTQKDNIELQDRLKTMQQKMGKLQKKVDIMEKETSKIQSLQKKLKEQEDRITKLQEDYLKLRQKMQKITDNPNNSDKQKLPINDINYLLVELEKHLINQLSKTKSDINITTNQIQQQIIEITNNVNPIVLNFKSITEQLIRNNKKISNDLWKLNDDLYKHQTQDHPSSDGLLQSRLNDLQTKFNSHIKDHSNIQAQISSGHRPQTSTRVQVNSYHKDEENKFSSLKQQNRAQERQDPLTLKREIIDKLKQQKGDFNKALKKLDIITVKKQQDKFRTISFEDKLLRLEHLILGKVDEKGLKKWMRNIQNKIAYLYRIVNMEATQEDARIARKGWTCLSCDKKLDVYQGRVGTHIASSLLKTKGIETQVMGGGMLFKNHSRMQLPQFKKDR